MPRVLVPVDKIGMARSKYCKVHRVRFAMTLSTATNEEWVWIAVTATESKTKKRLDFK